ncbi:MAG TPA: DNA internalization-related competence protein ComEC/Rec2 [Armatimonadota bacterium]|jgi:competence protein ComEC
MQRALPAVAIAFCAGAAARLTVHIPAALFFVGLALTGIVLFVARRPRASLAAAMALFAFAGALRAGAWLAPPADSAASLSGLKWVRLHGVVDADPMARPWGTALEVHADRAETRRGMRSVSGRVRIYVPEGDRTIWRYGMRLAAEGRVSLPDDAANPGETPPAQFLRRDGIVAVMSPRAVRIEPGGGGNPVLAFALHAKNRMERGIRATLPPAPAGLLTGLLFSETSSLPEDTQRDFARAGTVHILSTSGLHVAILAGLLGLILPARRPGARKWRAGILLAALIFFALMTGMRPAVARSVVMMAALLAAPIFDREPDIWCSLSLAALALAMWSPGNLLDPGFQLSFAAAVALALWFAPRGGKAARPGPARWGRHAVTIAATSVVASLATAPLSARYFGTFSLAAPLSNILIVPAVGPAMALGLVQGATHGIWPAAARAAAALNRPVLGWMLGATRTVSGWGPSAWETGPVPDAAVVGFLAAFAAFLWLRLRRKRFAWTAALPAAVALAWVAWPPRPLLRVTFLDVGQGDCALIQTSGGRSVLIDAGGRPEMGSALPSSTGERIVVPALRRAGVRRLDAVILTHPHEDHAGGLPAVLTAFPVRLWLDSGQPHPAPGFTESLKLAAHRGVPLRLARAGDRVDLQPGIELDVLGPRSPLMHGTRDDLNNNSIVCRLTCGSTAFLFCGDEEREAEERLLRSGAVPRADVLKAGHHGSATSSATAFLAAVRPRFAVISCGRHNRYGHPAAATLERLRAAGARVYRTDVDGGIVAESDGRAVTLHGSRWEWP